MNSIENFKEKYNNLIVDISAKFVEMLEDLKNLGIKELSVFDAYFPNAEHLQDDNIDYLNNTLEVEESLEELPQIYYTNPNTGLEAKGYLDSISSDSHIWLIYQTSSDDYEHIDIKFADITSVHYKLDLLTHFNYLQNNL